MAVYPTIHINIINYSRIFIMTRYNYTGNTFGKMFIFVDVFISRNCVHS